MAPSSYWLLKTEPLEWGWEHQADNKGISHWDGVRNAQAQKHMRTMQKGDLAFFYHTGKRPAVVGVVEVIKTAYPDASDESGKSCMVDVRALMPLPKPVPLTILKTDDGMSDWILLRQPRLSVMPVTAPVWSRVCELGDLSPVPSLPMQCESVPTATKQKKKGARKEIPEQVSSPTTDASSPSKPGRSPAIKKKATQRKDSKQLSDNILAEEIEKVVQKRKARASLTSSLNTDAMTNPSTAKPVVAVVEVKTYQRVRRKKTISTPEP